MDPATHELNRSYVLHGSGGITTVQTRLVEHGRCDLPLWAPCPPDWRMRFVTYLSPDELLRLLGDVIKHYTIRLYPEVTVHAAGV